MIYHRSKKILLAISSLRSERIPRISVRTLWSEAQTIRRRFNHWREKGVQLSKEFFEPFWLSGLAARTIANRPYLLRLLSEALEKTSARNCANGLSQTRSKEFRFSWKPLLHLFIDACEVYHVKCTRVIVSLLRSI